MASTAAAATESVVSGIHPPSQYRLVGVLLAVASGILIGSSFVFKKKGLIQSQAGKEAGVGVDYLKNPLWWIGMTLMIIGEICNFGAYAFTEAIIVTPLGALSVVICAILSSFLLNEKLSFFGWIGCFQCIVGSVVIAINGPREQSVSTIAEFKTLFLAPGFLSFGGAIIVVSLVIIFYFAPRYGHKSMLWYILVCSLIGGLSVSCTQGLGASIVTSIRGHNQFKNWFIYFLLAFVVITLLTEIYFLNVALALFNTAMVTPTYYVIFTFCTLATSVILYQGLKSTPTQIITVVLGFLTICSGIILLQMSKVDPEKLQKLDKRSTILLKVANEEVQGPPGDTNKELGMSEEPGMDALRGTFGIAGTMVRARRRSTISGPGWPSLDLTRSRSSAVAVRAFPSMASDNANGNLSVSFGHDIEKSATAPALTGDAKITRPSPTHFWHRRTGSGPRAQRMSSTERARTQVSHASQDDGHGPVRERDPSALGGVAEGDERGSGDHGKELSMRTLLNREQEREIRAAKTSQLSHVDPLPPAEQVPRIPGHSTPPVIKINPATHDEESTMKENSVSPTLTEGGLLSDRPTMVESPDEISQEGGEDGAVAPDKGMVDKLRSTVMSYFTASDADSASQRRTSSIEAPRLSSSSARGTATPLPQSHDLERQA